MCITNVLFLSTANSFITLIGVIIHVQVHRTFTLYIVKDQGIHQQTNWKWLILQVK